MAKRTPELCFRYVVEIRTNGHLDRKEFEGKKSDLPRLNEECHRWMKDQMFSPEGDFYFQRDLKVWLEFKDEIQPWDAVPKIPIFDDKLDLETHLGYWEDERMYFPFSAPQAELKYDGLVYKVLPQNVTSYYQVLGELNDA